MYKMVWVIVGICVFLGVTLGALSTQNLHYGKRVKFVNVNLAVRNSNSEVVNQTITVPSQVVTQNSTVTTTIPASTKTNTVSYQTEYSTNTSTRNDMYSQNYKYDNTKHDSVLKGNTKVKTKKVEYGEPIQNYKTSQTEYSKSITKFKTPQTEYGEPIPKYKTQNTQKNTYDDPQYAYDDIDWSKWKSNFVNRILDDSLVITELDKYPNGAFFYYSFIVDYEGNISNVSVRSVYLSDTDKKIVSEFIKGYAHTPITRFPKKTNRKTARVSAIMMLSSSETVHSKPSDFNDTERIKYQVK